MTAPKRSSKLLIYDSRRYLYCVYRAPGDWSNPNTISLIGTDGDTVDGEFKETTDVLYDDQGKRIENVTYAPMNTLTRVMLTKEDFDDFRNHLPFVLTTEDLPQYNLKYAGQQHVDDLDTYVFHVEPKKEDHRYFQGRIWVDSQDFQIVKVCGKSGPEKIARKKGRQPDLHPTFVT